MKRIFILLLVLIVFISGFDVDVFAETINLSSPVVSCGNTTSESVKVYWNKVDGANKYYVYRKGHYDREYTLIAKTSKCYYLDKEKKGDEIQFESGETNSYKVIAYNILDGKIKAKGKTSKSVEIVYYSFKAPELTIKLSDKSGVPVINMDGGKGLYRSKNKDSGYSVLEEYNTIKTTDSPLRRDSTVKSNSTYYYKTFKTYNYDGKEYTIWSKPVKVTTSDVDNEHIVKFKTIKNGKQLPSGTAITCSAIMLNHLGFDVSKMEMVKYFDCVDDFKQKGDQIYGYNPDCHFIGDPTSNKSYGLGTNIINIYYTIEDYLEEMGYTVGSGYSTKDDYKSYTVSAFLNSTEWVANVNEINEMKDYLDNDNIAIFEVVPEKYRNIDWQLERFSCTFRDRAVTVTYFLWKNTKYMILCGYSGDYWVLYNPETGKYEKSKIFNVYEGYEFLIGGITIEKT